MSCAFFLCAVRNFNQRLEHDKKKLRCTFPEAPELMRKVSARNMQHHLGRQTGSPSFVLTGLVKACRGVTKQDVLAQYSFRDEVAVWSHFWRGANNLFTVTVEDAFMFQYPMPVFTRVDAGGQGQAQESFKVGVCLRFKDSGLGIGFQCPFVKDMLFHSLAEEIS